MQNTFINLILIILGFSMFTNESLKEIASSQLLKSIYSGQVSVMFLPSGYRTSFGRLTDVQTRSVRPFVEPVSYKFISPVNFSPWRKFQLLRK